jgi:hypothetical protein
MRRPLPHPLALSWVALAICAPLVIGCDDEPTPTAQPTNGGQEPLTCTPGDVKVCASPNAPSCSGVARCGEDGRWPGAEVCEFPEEVCDGFDQDCDGQIDETFTTLGDACDYVGATCSGAGVLRCDRESGGAGVICVPDGPLSTDPERCDGDDNDCDGLLDEGFDLGAACSAGVGQCAVSGVKVCAEGGQSSVCGATPNEPRAEQCNSLDDDCDGQLDETFDVGGVCSAGRGACYTEGVYECNSSGRGLSCTARAGASSPEACDTQDNDCDGKTDEGMPAQITLTRLDLEAAVMEGEVGLTVSARVDRFSVVGELVSTSFDEEGDGAADRVFTYVYADSKISAAQVDAEGDGVVDLDLVFNYDEVSGLHTSTTAFAAGTDGPAVSEWTYTYTAEGLLEEESIDEDFDGVIDHITTYTYDAQGRVATEETLVDSSGDTLLYTRAFTYEGDSTSPSTATLTGDTAAAGLGDGVVEATYAYDAARLSRVDYSDGSAVVTRDEYAYGCWAE